MGLAVAFASAAVAAMPAAAQAAVTWTQPAQVVSLGEQDSDGAAVGTDASGNAVAVWRTQYTTTETKLRVAAAFRPAGGNFGLPIPISAELDAEDVVDELNAPRIAVNARGDAVAVWYYRFKNPPNTPERYALQASFRPAGGGFGAPVQIGPLADIRFPSVAIDPAGNVMVVYRYSADCFNCNDEARMSYRPVATGTFTAPVTISTPGEDVDVSDILSDTDDRYNHHTEVALDAQGNALAAWTAGAGSPVVRAAFKPVGQAFAAPATLSTANFSSVPSVAFDGAGNALVAWHSNNPFPPPGEPMDTTRTSFRPAGSASAFGVEQLIPAADGVSDQAPQLAFDIQGNALAVWTNYDSPQDFRVYAAHRPAGGSFQTATPVADAGRGASEPRVGIDLQGNAIAAWTSDDSQDVRALAAFRPAGAGADFQAPVPISEPGDFPDPNPNVLGAGPLDLAVAANGYAHAVWARSDGVNLRVEGALGSPPGTVLPPPPPPGPDPEKPNVLQPAEPFKRGRAVVITANVVGDITQLEWDLPGGHPDVVGTVVDGQLQRSVRFRPSAGDKFTVRVRAVGPGGSANFVRSFTAPRPAGGDAEAIARRHIDNANVPRVFAVGHANALLGKASASAAAVGCGPMSVLSGDQKLGGCFGPAENIGDIPDAERGVLDAVARELNLRGAADEVMKAAVAQTDGYIARGQAVINDQWPVIPGARGAVAAFPQAKALASSDGAMKVGGQLIKQQGGFLLKFDPKKAGIDLGPIPRPPSLPSIGGFRLVGDFDVDLERREARITAHLKLPSFLKKAGIEIQNEVKMRATLDEIIIDEATIGPINVNIGALDVDEFRIAYRRAEDTWQGQGKACVVKGICLDMIPPNGQIKIKGGRLDFAGASLGFPLPGIPLFSGVNLERIGFGFGLDPTRFTGNARLTFAHLLVVDGRIVIAFPTAQTPFFLKRDEVGNDFPAKLYTYRYTGTTVGLSAAAALRLPVVGEVPLANAYVLYEFPGYLALGGGMNYGFREPLTGVSLISVGGRVDGEFNAGNGRFNVDGHVHACVVEIICKGVDGNVSNNGMSVCTTVDAFIHELHMGGAIRWSPFKFIPYLDGCKWGRFREPNVRGARAAQAGGAYTVQIASNQPSRMVMLEGVEGAPGVRVTGPGGQLLESPAGSEIATTQDAKIRIMRSQSAKFVAVGFADAAPGTYSIEHVAGSPAIGKVQESSALPNARVSGKVRGKGKRRVLNYRIGRRPDQIVSFFELGAGGGGKLIGSTSRAGKGRLRFSPAPGRGTRRIEARFELDGVPAEQKVIARFRPPSPKLGKPRGLRVRRKGKGLRVSWARVKGATRYELALTTSLGRQRFLTTRKRKAVLKRVPKFAGGRVSVRAVDQLRQGAPKVKRFKRTARRRLNFQRLPRCKVKRKVVCRR